MRHLLALFVLSFALVACDKESTTSPAETETTPTWPSAPLASITVVTGTASAPVDSPTVRVKVRFDPAAWATVAYTSDTSSTFGMFESGNVPSKFNAFNIVKYTQIDTTFKVGCFGENIAKVLLLANGEMPVKDSSSSRMTKSYPAPVLVYCKAP